MVHSSKVGLFSLPSGSFQYSQVGLLCLQSGSFIFQSGPFIVSKVGPFLLQGGSFLQKHYKIPSLSHFPCMFCQEIIMVSSCMPSGIIRTNNKWNIRCVGTKNDDTQHNFGPRHRGTKFVQPITDIPDHKQLSFSLPIDSKEPWLLHEHKYFKTYLVFWSILMKIVCS